MAQDIKYGDKECQPDNTTALEIHLRNITLNITHDQFCLDNEQRCDNADDDLCYWRYLGTGYEYQLLAGPIYIVFFAISGIPMGLISELQNVKRKWILSGCIFMWSLMTILGGLASEFWHLVVTRLFLGIFSAGCVPFITSIIADYFVQEHRGAALGFSDLGIYLGYSGTFILILVEKSMGWRWVYFIAGIPGILAAILVGVTVKEPPRAATSAESEKVLTNLTTPLSKLKTAAKHFLDPVLLLLCIGGSLRNGGGIVWAFNIKIFFDEYHPGTDLEKWMTWIPLVFGSIGVFVGGYSSDKLFVNQGIKGRLFLLTGCVFFSAPFIFGILYLPMPYAVLMHIPLYIIGEMWIGIADALIIDVCPKDLTASSVAVYFFILQIVGGNINLLVTPIRQNLDLRLALLITFPGLYMLATIVFLITLAVLYRKLRLGKYSYDMASKVGDGENETQLSPVETKSS